jgi:CHAD domain-containing protein
MGPHDGGIEHLHQMRRVAQRREHEAANTRSTVAQSSSVIPVSMVAPPEADLP